MKINKYAHDKIIRQAEKHPAVEVTGVVARQEVPNFDGYWVVPMQNVSRHPDTEYAWDPREMGMRWDRFDELGWEPFAIYHSHPGGRSDPSETDMVNAMQVGFFYLIAYPIPNGEWRLSAFECIEIGILVGADLVVVP